MGVFPLAGVPVVLLPCAVQWPPCSPPGHLLLVLEQEPLVGAEELADGAAVLLAGRQGRQRAVRLPALRERQAAEERLQRPAAHGRQLGLVPPQPRRHGPLVVRQSAAAPQAGVVPDERRRAQVAPAHLARVRAAVAQRRLAVPCRRDGRRYGLSSIY